ncbi:MAG: helix-turn-helix transcriptional regulator, partial [bacterium]|nr:helix-turn-helix transcriptional regulator [bacterium]
MDNNIAGRLKQIRESLKLNREKMGKFLGVSDSAYSKNELGQTVPGRGGLRILFTKLGISMDWFLFGEGPKYFKEKIEPEPQPEPE